jgi:ABC-type phosphate/phosphonate transport system substrate-binding protein
MIASLPMYDLPELAAATVDWWRGLRRHMAEAGVDGLPADLVQPDDLYAHWQETDLAVSQTCGYPLTHGLGGRVQLLATPRYAAQGCTGSRYLSHVVVRATDPAKRFADLRGRRVAFNGRDSQSGYNVLRHLAAPLAAGRPFFAATVESGAHRRSLAMVRTGEADLAAVDCVTFALLERVAPAELAGIRILCSSAAAPALPYITSLRTTAGQLAGLRRGLLAAAADPALAATRDALLIDGFDVLPVSAYDDILVIEAAAVSIGYVNLA